MQTMTGGKKEGKRAPGRENIIGGWTGWWALVTFMLS